MTQQDKLEALLDDAKVVLKSACEKVLKFEQAAREAGYEQTAAECGAYLCGHLENFLDNEEQSGSIPSLLKSLSEETENCTA